MQSGISETKSHEVEEYYNKLYTKCGEIIAESFRSDHRALQSASHNYIADLDKWIKVLSSRPENEMLKAASREYQYALLAVIQGQYRQAFMALRLFLELSLGSIHFSANELKLRIWIQDKSDLKWSPIIDSQEGIFSKEFVKVFCEELADEASQYGAIAKEIYRECSEFVHGNAKTHKIIPEKLEYIDSIYVDWHEKARNARLVVTFALCARYLKFIDQKDREIVELEILDELGHVEEVRSFFDKH